MPALDRRITVRVSTTGFNAFSEPESTTTDYPVWATLVQDRVTRGIGEAGVYANADRVWRVRFNQVFLDAIGSGEQVDVIVGSVQAAADGSMPNANFDTITGIGEPERADRRRFLDLLSQRQTVG